MTPNRININNLFYIFIASHLVIWTLVPALTNHNLPLDTIEALAWGSILDWGFNKHPPLSAFFLEIFYQIFGSKDWAYYLLSQIFVVISFFIVWKFSQEFFNNRVYSLLAVLLLEGIYFYNFTTPEFNVNVCQLPLWTLSILYCWKGIRDNKSIDWFLLGVFTALGFLSKYLFIYVAVTIDLVILYMIVKKKIDFKCLVSLIPLILILCPHLIWLTENEYVTITYGLHRAGSGDQSFLDHVVHPIIFLGKQIGILIPFLIMSFFTISKIKSKFNFKDEKLIFLLTINVIPILLMLLTSIVMGIKIRTMWMTPFYLFFGVLIIYIFQSQINLNKLKNFTIVFTILFMLSPFAYAYISITQTDKRTDYNGKEIAESIQREWDKNFINEIKAVFGNEWIAGNLSYHLESRPSWNNAEIYLDVLFIGNEQKPCKDEKLEAFDGKGKIHCFNMDPQVVMMGGIE